MPCPYFFVRLCWMRYLKIDFASLVHSKPIFENGESGNVIIADFGERKISGGDKLLGFSFAKWKNLVQVSLTKYAFTDAVCFLGNCC